MIRAAFFDIDGTLVGFHEEEVRDEVLVALDALRARGISGFISSGHPKGLIHNLRDYPFDGYITCNGSLVTLGGEILHSAPIRPEPARRIAEIAGEQHFPCAAFFAEEIGINFHNETTARINELLHVPTLPLIDLREKVRTEPVFAYTVYVTEAQWEAHFRGKVDGVAWPRWHPEFVDVTPDDSSKATAIARVLERLGLDRSEIIAFGDGGNDIDMLRYAGIGVAMGNADETVKAAADYVTTDVDADGIRNALRHFHLL